MNIKAPLWVDSEGAICEEKIMEYWRRSKLYRLTQRNRMKWTASYYARNHAVPQGKAFKALDKFLYYRRHFSI